MVDFTALRQIGGSSLTDRPSRSVRRAGGGRGAELYVPFRNAHLLSAAVSWGEVIGARAIFVGAVWEDSSGYPDCRPEFYQAFEEAVRLGTRPETRCHRHARHLVGKAEIVRRGLALGVPFERTWSCYQAEDAACGACESCRLRLRGFREAGAPDPISYRTSA